MSKDLLGTLQRFSLVLEDQSNDIMEWVLEEAQAENPDRVGISQRLGFIAATQAYISLTEYYIEEWNFVSEEDFGKAIQIAGDGFRSYVSQAHIIPNNVSWFDGIKAQILDKLQGVFHNDNFFDQALEKSLEQYNEVIDEEIRNGFKIAFDFINNLSPDDFEIELSAEFEKAIQEQTEQAESKGYKVLTSLLHRLGFGSK